ncbi:MAG: phosphoribosylanthranilate isomerase [Pseudomonadota bacterium]
MVNTVPIKLLHGWPSAQRSPLVKICGITEPRLAEGTVAAGAQMVGIVHFPPSPRHLEAEAAREVAAAARGAIVVALTVDASDDVLDRLMETVRPGGLQLHGKETPARVAELAERYGVPVAKAFGVASAEDLHAMADYCALPVLDAKPPKNADRPGGHGGAFDWSLLDGLSETRPFMLSGGLGPDNVAEAVRRVRPYAVDVSSKVETGGIKDLPKIEAFVSATRRAGGAAGPSD